ncbi:MAG: PQQ-dependent sugar dehydrogenase [Anaerolineales bacterium]|uniref:PQQ-dependent sugar dehydrogenase n=1 Tax=Candidatus Villigracilis vicinus TaxID=3140679 RepID=UPI00313535CA|nr:PQQ-dependent sugar dehydrogenase [Anaerolineales bacterium]MBK9781326.1 PQQ-dependent sugar dehydrogenase [Anaerolineales bacterium]
MKRLLLFLTLPMLACGGSGLAAPTITPLSPTGAVSAPQTESQSETPTSPPTLAPTINASQFPDPNNFAWVPVVDGLNRPVDLQSAFDGSGRLFIIEKYGVIRIFKDGQLMPQPFLNIEDRVDDGSNEMGLLGLAFHPDYEQNGYFYVNYTGDGGNTRISRFQAVGDSADPNSEQVLMVVDQPFPNHNGGAVVFGPDGYLYLGLGDGGAAGDPFKNGQNTGALLGKILRIDVNNGVPYAVPADNPFGNEVWAYGLRNPWRMSFDRDTGDLWIGDVGQNKYEEIDYLPAGSAGGANFGWSIMEASYGYDGTSQPGMFLPAAEYSHDFGCSVTGGYVYRGSMPEWNGVYLYGDYCTGTVWGLILSNGQWQSQVMFETDLLITSFGVDEAGELYLVSDNGSAYILARK